MQEGTFEWYKAIFNSLLKSDMKNFQNQKDCYDLLLNMKIDLKFDDKQIKNYALKISQYTHKMADYMAGMTGNGQFDELYWNLLLFEAPDLLDSYCLYVEKDRKPQERFYQPRRKTLIKVVNLLQRLEDDELDEAFIHMPARVGKLISDDTPVFTKDGWKRHGELKLGDKVVGSDGKYTSVICVHPKYHTTHTVTLSDGTEIDCHYRHEWTVYDKKRGIWQTLETKDIIGNEKFNDRYRYYLPKRPIMEGQKKELRVHPYVLGAWLGDGTNRKPMITEPKCDHGIIRKVVDCGYEISHQYIHKTTGVITTSFNRKMVDDLRSYGMCYYTSDCEKHIPEEYLMASIDQRLELLAGLLDTDGTLCRKERRYQFSTVNERLRDDFVDLLSTFGWRASVVRYEPQVSTSGIIGRQPVYVIGFNPNMNIPCVIERKKLYEFSDQKRLSIRSIRKSDKKQGNCITVANNDGIYLVGRHMIPTHNTQIITLGMSWHCCRNTEKSNLYCSYKEDAGGAFLDGVKEIWTDPIYRHADVFPKAQIVDTDAKANTIDLERKKKYKSLSGKGLTSGLNGLYDAVGWLVADDILSGIEDVLSPDVLARKQMLFDNNLMKRKKGQCKVLYNGTIWSLHDIYMDRVNFLETAPEAKDVRWEILKIPALDPETDESNFDYDYGVGFSTKYYRMERAKFEANDDMASWFSQCQQEPIERDGAVFNPEHMNFYNGVLPDEIPLKIVAACDVALGGTDFLSMPVAYVYEDGSVYIHDVVFDSSEKSVTQPKVVDCLIRNNVTNSFFEANNGGEGYKDDIDRLLKERGHKINLVSKFAQQMIVNAGKGGSKTAQRKEQRIWDNAQTIRSFYFRDSGHQSLEYRKFMNQLYSFTVNGKNKHDDSPDSLAELAVFLNKGSGTQTTQVVSSPFGRRR